jgi:hypothetical protein
MRYLKLLATVLGAVAVGIAAAVTNGHIDTTEKLQIAIQVTTIIGVWMVANLPAFTYGKTLIAAVLLFLNGVIAALTDGISNAEWVNLIIAVATTLGVLIVPNRPAVTTTD